MGPYSGFIHKTRMCFRYMETRLIFVIFLLLYYHCDSTVAVNLSNCQNPLGMESGEIPDSAITASSSYDDGNVGPKSGRIQKEIHGGAWCPKPVISRDVYEYLQVDLGELVVVSMVGIQGRFGNGQGQEYTKQFLLEYQREDTSDWMRFRNKRGEETFEGNSNTYLVELREVSPPIIGKRIRFIPYSQHPRTMCMRVEIYGCKWNDDTVSYSMPQGDRRGSEVDLFDFTYDGLFENNYLSDGLGQLADGETGEANFRHAPLGLGMRGYQWVGWKNESTTAESSSPIEIIFKFETVRNFTELILHCNNFFSKEVRVFKTALIYFSIGGKYYLTNPVRFEFVRDTVVELARHVVMRLENNVGRYVKLALYFDARWMMISEVHFNSEPAHGNFTEELPPPTTLTPTTVGEMNDGMKDGFDIEIEMDGAQVEQEYGGPASAGSAEGPRKAKKAEKIEDDYYGIIIGALSALIVIIVVIIAIILIHHRRQKQNNNRRSLKPVVDRHVTINLNDLRGSTNGKISNRNMYNSVATDENESDKEMCNESRDYAVPDVTKSSLIVVLPPQQAPVPPVRAGSSLFTNTLDKPPTYDALYAAADVVNVQVPNIPSLQGVSGNNTYAVPNADLLLSIDHPVPEFPRENLCFIEILGEGQFGEVHLSEAMGINEFINDDYFINRTTTRPMLVAVKLLSNNADERARADFRKEIKIMSQLKDPNIVRVLGVCTKEEPLCMIVEYMKYGDLNQFILDHVPESPVAQATSAKTLSYGCLIYMASQIASGMKYLESLNMVHRDLAMRNCLVGANFTIKISDFGMSRSLYSADYYRIEGRASLPIRWMAWESILLGKFTTKSDVWSFAVTLWEILTFAKDQPFESLTDEQVIENAGHYYRNDNRQVYLPEPPNCLKEIYDLMRECWNRQESERPSHREIHMFLQRKNMGYNPKDEKLSQINVPIC